MSRKYLNHVQALKSNPVHTHESALFLLVVVVVSAGQLPILLCIQLGRITNVHVLLSPPSLLAAPIENNNCQVDDNNGRLRSPKKEERERKRRRNYTQEETAKAEGERTAEKSALMSLMAVACSEKMIGIAWRCARPLDRPGPGTIVVMEATSVEARSKSSD